MRPNFFCASYESQNASDGMRAWGRDGCQGCGCRLDQRLSWLRYLNTIPDPAGQLSPGLSWKISGKSGQKELTIKERIGKMRLWTELTLKERISSYSFQDTCPHALVDAPRSS
jgi:hypothetical protein